MGELISIITIIKGIPTEFALGLSTFAAIVVIWMKSRDIDITAATSISKLQNDQITSLLAQNKALGEDLTLLRNKMAETYELMENMRNRINDLESLIRDYKRRCDTCPDRLYRLRTDV